MCSASMEEKNCIMRADTPLKAIACFDAVMRTGSATLAAEQLFVTPGAVGQQLRKLERWLGVTLFARQVRRLQPTDQALRYWAQIQPALQQIDAANAVFLETPSSRVRLSLPPALAGSWFARRMPELTRAFPDLDLHLNAMASPVDLDVEGYDMAVRHFDGQAAHLNVTLLLKDELRVYCSPDYQAQHTLDQPQGLADVTLLDTSTHPHWARWLAEADAGLQEPSRRMRFDQSELAIDAARRGQGVVLTSPWLVEDDVQQGRLIRLFATGLVTGKHYYLVTSKQRPLSAAAQRLHAWLASH